MADEKATHAEQTAHSIWYDAARWRERALASNPHDSEIRKGFHMGIACLLMEDIVGRLGAGADLDQVQEEWSELGLQAALFVIDQADDQTDARKGGR